MIIGNDEFLLGLGPDEQAGINLWKCKVGFAYVLVAVDHAAIPEAREGHILRNLQEGFVIVTGAVALKSVQLVEVWLSDVVVQVAFPKNVLGGRACIFACFAFALVVVDEASGEKTVRGSDTPADDTLQ